MKTEILISGFGGQGLMRLGKILAQIALKENKHTSWFPSYGAEMRGGAAHCFVKISDSPIGSPFIESPDIAIILNQPSFTKFKKCLNEKSLAIINSDLISQHVLAKSIKKIALPLNQLALACNNPQVVNVIVLGLLACLKKKLFKRLTALKVLRQTFTNKAVLADNLRAFNQGENIARKYKGS